MSAEDRSLNHRRARARFGTWPKIDLHTAEDRSSAPTRGRPLADGFPSRKKRLRRATAHRRHTLSTDTRRQSSAWVRRIILEYLSEYRGSRALSYSRIFSRIYIAQAALQTRIQPSNERYSGKLTVSGAPMVKWWRRINRVLTHRGTSRMKLAMICLATMCILWVD